jgi:hypothetical protein
MAKLVWDQVGEKEYQLGVEKGVIYKQKDGEYPSGAAWNGLKEVSQNPTGAESTKLYANNGTYLNLISNEDFEGSITAYMYPDEFAECDGSLEVAAGVYLGQQTRKPFGLTYKTLIGNDTNGDSHGYILHLVYGATVSPSERTYSTESDDPEAIEMSWDFTTTPVEVDVTVDGTQAKPLAHIELNSTKVDKTKIKSLEDILYGSETAEARLPLPTEVINIFKDQEA